MIRIINAYKNDVRFQFRQGFYLIYLILALIYIAAIYQVSDRVAVILIPVLIYFDPAMVGFMFTGGLVMLESQQGITGYIGITPFRTLEYIIARVLSMVVLAVLISLLISVSSAKTFNFPVLISSVTLIAVFHSLLGILASARCRSMNDYFIKMIPYMVIIILPVIGFIEKPWAMLFRIFPGFAGLRLVLSAYSNGVSPNYLFDYIIMISWCIMIFVPAVRKFDREMIRR
jgi:fluoroquinolone transport system permease protein